MTEQEARQILGVSEETAWEEILKVSDNFIRLLFFDFLLLLASQQCKPILFVQKYDVLFEQNAKNGSFYIQSKVHRAKECLETAYRGKADASPS